MNDQRKRKEESGRLPNSAAEMNKKVMFIIRSNSRTNSRDHLDWASIKQDAATRTLDYLDLEQFYRP